MILEKAGGPVAYDVIVKGSTSERIDVAASFRAVVDQIVGANREPTEWEAGCLYAALCEVVIGREKNALRRIGLARLPGAQQELPVSIAPLPTAEELLRALKEIVAAPL